MVHSSSFMDFFGGGWPTRPAQSVAGILVSDTDWAGAFYYELHYTPVDIKYIYTIRKNLKKQKQPKFQKLLRDVPRHNK